MGSRSDKMEFWGPNDLDNVGQPDVYITWDLTNKQAYSSMGLNLLFGADYYFSDAIYVGFEAGLGFGTTSFGNHEIGTSDLTAFNIQFNGAFDPTTAGAAVADSFVGELPFNVCSKETSSTTTTSRVTHTLTTCLTQLSETSLMALSVLDSFLIK